MAPPTSKPRLADIDPSEWAKTVSDRVRDHVYRMAMALSPAVEVQGRDDATNIYWSAELLAGYAQRGLAATDWPDDGCANDAIIDVCGALYSHASAPGTFGIGDAEDAAAESGVPTTDDGLVIVAAIARMRLAARGGSVTARELATLAGVTDHQIRHIARTGELAMGDGRGGTIKRADAVRWLAARGVPGFNWR